MPTSVSRPAETSSLPVPGTDGPQVQVSPTLLSVGMLRVRKSPPEEASSPSTGSMEGKGYEPTGCMPRSGDTTGDTIMPCAGTKESTGSASTTAATPTVATTETEEATLNQPQTPQRERKRIPSDSPTRPTHIPGGNPPRPQDRVRAREAGWSTIPWAPASTSSNCLHMVSTAAHQSSTHGCMDSCTRAPPVPGAR
jgi:hypothetical protein